MPVRLSSLWWLTLNQSRKALAFRAKCILR